MTEQILSATFNLFMKEKFLNLHGPKRHQQKRLMKKLRLRLPTNPNTNANTVANLTNP